MNTKEFIEKILSISFGGDRRRPYTGQEWTWLGERGRKKILTTMTLRDLGDSICESLRDFPGLEKVDLEALTSAVLRRVEQDILRGVEQAYLENKHDRDS